MRPALTTEPAHRARYAQGGGIHRIIPAAVGQPRDLEQLRALLDTATTEGWSVTPRGAGSAMGGGNIGEGLILDLTRFDEGRCLLDAPRQRAVVSPGLPLAALQSAAHPYGLHCPIDPSSARWVTIGGLVSTNAAGPRTVRDGPMRDWVEGLTLLTDDGALHLARGVVPEASHPVVQRCRATLLPLLAQHREPLLARWPRTRKNTLGYAFDAWYRSGDLLDLVIGAEGTLGVITEVTVRLAPIVAHAGTVRIALAERAMLVDTIAELGRHAPVRVELLDRSFLRLVEPDRSPVAAILLVDLEDDDGERLHARLGALTDALRFMRGQAARVEVATTPAAAHALWAIRHGASPRLAALTDGRRSLQVIEDGCVPPPHLGAYLDAVETAAGRQGIDAVMFGHAGDAHVHVNLLPDLGTTDWLPRVRRVHDEVVDALLALGGTPAGEHGAGRLRAGVVERFLGPDALVCSRALRQAFAPSNRFNPGVILEDGHDPFTRLKVGRDAARIPPAVAEWLMRIEAEALWGMPRWTDGDALS